MLCGFFVSWHLPLRRACKCLQRNRTAVGDGAPRSIGQKWFGEYPGERSQAKKRACYSLVAGPFL